MTRPTAPITKKVAREKKKRKLFRHAPSKGWKDDITAGRDAYPYHLMLPSKAKTLDADPKTRENYNPVGNRGERRYMPPQCRDLEDEIDQLSPSEAIEAAKGWPSSIGSCFDARGL